MAVLGPTASAKTELSISLAEHLGAEVISVDSMQVYREMDIGTAKPNLVERRGIPHHLIDVVDPSEDFSVARFRAIGREVIGSSEVPLVITGGSGLHFRALVDQMSFAPTSPELRQDLEREEHDLLVERLVRVDPGAGIHVALANPRRVLRAVEIYELTGETPSERALSAEAEDLRRYVPELEFTAVGVDPGSLLEERVEERLDMMRSGGLIEEVTRLWPRLGRTARTAVGYRQIGAYLDGEYDLETAFGEAARATKRLARRQRTWFQRDPRIRWVPWMDDPGQRLSRVIEALE